MANTTNEDNLDAEGIKEMVQDAVADAMDAVRSKGRNHRIKVLEQRLEHYSNRLDKLQAKVNELAEEGDEA